MTITLLAVSLNDQPLSQPITAHFDGSGGTVGRADHNTMALPDPERHISRLQAEVFTSGDTFVIRNVGAANPITVAGRTLARGETAVLHHGDEVRVGGYLLQVDARTQVAALDVTRGRAMLMQDGGNSGAMTTGGGVPWPAPAAAPLPMPPTPAPTPAPTPLPMPRTAPQPTAGAGAAAANPFADLLGPGAPPAPGPAAAADPFAALFGPAPGAMTAPRPAPSPPPPPPAQPAPPAWPAATHNDPFAGLMPGPAGIPPASPAMAVAPRPAPPRLPEHLDPFASLPGPPLGSAPPPAAASDPFAGLAPVAPPPSIDTLFGLGAGAAGRDDPLAAFMGGAAPAVGPGAGAPAGGGVPADPIEALFGSPPKAAPQAVQSDHVPALHAAYPAPRLAPVAPVAPAAPPVAMPAPAAVPAPHALPPPPPPPLPPPPPPVVQPAAAPRAASAPDGDSDLAAWAALCQGAGVSLPPPAAGVRAQMHEVGRILRSAVDGSLKLMAVRNSTRHELRASVTVIQPKNNNPLKFSPDVDAALQALLQPGARGFLDGPAAMEDAMQDLVGHSIGSVAGLRAALEGVLDRFAPEQLEGKLSNKSLLDNVLPGARKARLWDLYLQHQGAIRDEAQEDFHALFGKAFLAAYEQQVQQLKRNARQASAQAPREPGGLP
jgi:FHA domain-containing protein